MTPGRGSDTVVTNEEHEAPAVLVHAEVGLACNAPRPQPIADGQRDVVLCADVQDFVPVHVGEVLCVVQQTQLQAGSSTGKGATPQSMGS